MHTDVPVTTVSLSGLRLLKKWADVILTQNLSVGSFVLFETVRSRPEPYILSLSKDVEGWIIGPVGLRTREESF